MKRGRKQSSRDIISTDASASEEAVAMGERDDLQAIVGAQFLEQMLNVIAHGRATDSELTGHPGRVRTAVEKAQHLELAMGQGEGGNRDKEGLGRSGSPAPFAAPLIQSEPIRPSGVPTLPGRLGFDGEPQAVTADMPGVHLETLHGLAAAPHLPQPAAVAAQEVAKDIPAVQDLQQRPPQDRIVAIPQQALRPAAPGDDTVFMVHDHRHGSRGGSLGHFPFLSSPSPPEPIYLCIRSNFILHSIRCRNFH
jgi:hypothetical protein